jgi:hypothetical protein
MNFLRSYGFGKKLAIPTSLFSTGLSKSIIKNQGIAIAKPTSMA